MRFCSLGFSSQRTRTHLKTRFLCVVEQAEVWTYLFCHFVRSQYGFPGSWKREPAPTFGFSFFSVPFPRNADTFDKFVLCVFERADVLAKLFFQFVINYYGFPGFYGRNLKLTPLVSAQSEHESGSPRMHSLIFHRD
jgi:hypothetical protein